MTRRVKIHIRLGIRSDSPSDQSPHCPHEETLGPYLHIAKFLCKMSRSVSANFRRVSPGNIAEKTLGKKSDFYFCPQKQLFCARGFLQWNAKKRAFFLGWSVVQILEWLQQIFWVSKYFGNLQYLFIKRFTPSITTGLRCTLIKVKRNTGHHSISLLKHDMLHVCQKQ